MTSANGRHVCPAPGCDLLVPDAQFACYGDWTRLPAAERRAFASAKRGTFQHIRAMAAACDWYRANPR